MILHSPYRRPSRARRLQAPIFATIILTAGPLLAAVPLRWTVETSRAQPAVFEAYHGESLDLAATLQSYGKPVEIDPQAEWHIYWQTNGMADAWWSAPVPPPVPGRGVVTATFTPDMDPGAPAVNGFIGSPGNNYRAAFTIRFRHAPGATPNTLTKPVPILDLANTTVINAPWPTDETIKAVVREVVDETGIQAGVDENEVKGIVTNTVDKAYVEGLGISSVEESDINRKYAKNADYSVRSSDANHASIADSANSAGFADEAQRASAISDGNGNRFTYSDIYDMSSSVGEMSADIQSAYAWSQNVYRYMTANTNAWFTGTNYVTNAQQAALRHKFAFEAGMDLSVVPCSMALWEIRDGERVCVWDQRDWTSYYFEFKKRQIQDEINNLGTNKADRAWSHHTATGIYNPAKDTLWIDTPKVVLSAGYAWQRNVTTSGNGFFTLVSNGLWSFGNSAKGSFFEIKDFEGNSLFKVSKTDSYLADVAPQNVVPDGDDLLLRCLFSPPDAIDKTDLTVYGCNDLVTESWTDLSTADAPGTVSFTGVINDWTLRITPKNPQGKFFAFVKVKVEGQTKNEFAAPVEFQKIVIGGVTYTVGTATINGNTVLTLTR